MGLRLRQRSRKFQGNSQCKDLEEEWGYLCLRSYEPVPFFFYPIEV